MKTLVFALILMSFYFYTYSQKDSSNIWGSYSNLEQPELLLNLCENNNWFFTSCYLCQTESPHNNVDNQYFEILHGTFQSINNNIELRNNSGELFFLFQAVDTMNLKVTFAKKYLKHGDYLNRRSAFFEGHQCSSPMNDFFARWTIFDTISEEDSTTYEILRFSKPGFIFYNKDYEVEYLDQSIFIMKSN